ncbi:MAG: N-acetyldiaminopimelate deacetylase [Ruminococcaceae bacterium]|nr:N-acetyldiaminopimelate deacetylase [Oscillospiraceae bacterium]
MVMQIIEDRRALHQIPELDRDLPETMAYLRRSLEPLGCQVFSPMEGALCAYFDFGAEKTIAFRSDADALPITERSDAAYRSCHVGKMHACGHDGHMAIALELARRMDKKQRLERNVLIVFQPAEETTGGARDLCDTGVFLNYNVEAIFGLHLWPGVAAGEIFSRANEMMSRSCEVKVKITGKSAHIAKAYEGIDAMAAGVVFYQKVRELEQALPPEIFRILSFGKFQSGTVCNAVAGETVLEGTLRAFQDEVFFHLRDGIRTIGQEIAATTGCIVDIHMNDGYPAVMNPPALYDKIRGMVDFHELPVPSMITEDFSWYQRHLEGLFFFLGTGDSPALHADNFDFPEEILVKGAEFFEKIAEAYR